MSGPKQDHYLKLNEVPTHVITWGKPFECKDQDVILCITGNPGLPDFYSEFAGEIHKQTGLCVCVIGQAGHEEVANVEPIISNKNSHLYNLHGQILHKLDFIKLIDNSCRLHLIGHSIGAWEVIEMMESNDKLINRVASVNLLFPTLQRMADSKNGQSLNNFTRRIHHFIIFLVKLLCLLPQQIQDYLIKLYLNYNSLPLEYCPRVKEFLKPEVVKKVLFLAFNEMDTVKLLNTKGLNKIKHLTNVIYSIRDGWAPVSYIEDLKMFQPEIVLRDVNINHSFVLKSSIRVANMVVEYVKTKLQ